MYTYNVAQWILLFFIYCFLGWCVESTIVSLENKRLINRGFLKGPLLPLYGTGTILILFVSLPFIKFPIMVYIAGVISTTLLEYFTGWLMETIFNIKYWDYSKDKFNYKGRICLISSLFWGVLTLFVIYLIHKPISYFVTSISNINIIILISIIGILFILDLIYSTYNVLDLKRVLSFATKIKEEIEGLTIQLKEKTSSLSPTDLNSITNKINKLKEDYNLSLGRINFFHKQILKSYPTATSKKFNESFKQLKRKIEDAINLGNKN